MLVRGRILPQTTDGDIELSLLLEAVYQRHLAPLVAEGTVEEALKRQPSEYLRTHFHVTTSGMAWEPAILHTQCVLGADRVLYAMDYPYQFVPEEVQVTDGLPISEGDKKKLYQLNAERVFSLCGIY